MKHKIKHYAILACFFLFSTQCISVSAAEVNDPYYPLQWGFHNNAGYDIKLEQAWAYLSNYRNPTPVTVAIIDTGVDISHSELKDALWQNSGEIANDGIDNDHNGYIDDIHGWNFCDDNHVLYDSSKVNEYNGSYVDDHGTHAAGTIIAATNNGKGIAGIASRMNVNIMVLKVLEEKKNSDAQSGSVENVIKAIQYAEKMGARICNISFGTNQYDAALADVIERSDMLFVCSAGNAGRSNDVTPMYPASYPYDNVIAVADMNSYGTLADTSNYGAGSVDLAAPGTQIASTGVNQSYIYESGTSMAAPMVSGVAALLYARHDSMTATLAKQIINDSVTQNTSMNGLLKTNGYLNAYQTVTHNTAQPQIQLSEISKPTSSTIQIDVADSPYYQVDGIRWKKGIHNLEYFRDGSKGKDVKGQQITFKKSCIFTIWVKATNGLANYDVIQLTVGKKPTIQVKNQKKISSTKRTVTLKVRDKDGNLQKVWMTEANSKKKTQLTPDKNGRIKIQLNMNRAYRIYAQDTADNVTTYKLKKMGK
ncbi:MAG: S8 family peptidase [Lachnospiraceae bacterium]